MPQFLEDALRQQAAGEGLRGDEADHYVFGAMNNMGAVRGHTITAKGRAMQRKHDADQAKKRETLPSDSAHSYDWRQRSGLRHGGRK